MSKWRGLYEWLAERFFGAFDIPFLPQSLRSLPRPLLLHLSDTPSQMYPFVLRLAGKLQPDYLVHTGDIADELKLEENRSLKDEYRQKLEGLIPALESADVGEIFLIVGNHDDFEVISTLAGRSEVLDGALYRELGGSRVYMLHECLPEQESWGEELPDFVLFGHAPDTRTERPFFNGLFHIHVISLSSGDVAYLPYPAGTDNARKMLPPKIGL